MEREGQEVWAKRVARWRDSELTANEFAREIGVNANTFKHWAWKLGAAAGANRRSRQQRPRGERSASFVEVAVPGVPVVERDAVAAPKTTAASVFELVWTVDERCAFRRTSTPERCDAWSRPWRRADAAAVDADPALHRAAGSAVLATQQILA